MILLDGVPISDPFHGNFDLTLVPATDIAEIRVALSPASPLNGPGGNGGVIDVITRAARGKPQLRMAVQASDAPSGTGSFTAKAPIFGDVAVRTSASGTVHLRDLEVTRIDGTRADINEDGRALTAALRVEHAQVATQIAVDAQGTRRSGFVPPGEGRGAEVLVIHREDLFRGALTAQSLISQWLLSAKAYAQVMGRDATRFDDASLLSSVGDETLSAHRLGGALEADLALDSELDLLFATHLVREGAENKDVSGRTVKGSVTIAETSGGFAYRATSWLTLDGALGAAMPLSSLSSAWPEAKLSLTLASSDMGHLRLTAARKGRVPTLRERYELGVGDPSIGPEQSSSIEAELRIRPVSLLTATFGAYRRMTDDLIRYNDTRTRLVNFGDVEVRGLEARVDLVPLSWLTTGAAYGFAKATREDEADPPLDFFPEHRAEVFASVRALDVVGCWARLRYTGSRVDNGATLTPYTTLEGSVFVTVDSVRILVRGENLLGTRYDARAEVPGAPRTLLLGLEAELN